MLSPIGTVYWVDYFYWRRLAMHCYHRMPARHFVGLTRKYGATHVVREAWSPRLDLPALYEDDEYIVYALPAGDRRS